LNQIEKAYGPNNAILDNCHVRIAFAANDERTAKRISDSLGTATELRAQRNYAGHRLAPWLAHVMVSRQETARPLLTPGEVMQLPPTDELVLLAGVPPIRAKKLRYFEDANFVARRLSAPEKAVEESTAVEHDWIGAVASVAAGRVAEVDDDADGQDDGGPRRVPELDPEREPVPAELEGTDVHLVAEEADGDGPRDAKTMRKLTPVERAHGINVGAAHDPIRDF
jgi:type IV secretion system protein VirD4